MLATVLLVLSYVACVAEAGLWGPRRRPLDESDSYPPHKRSYSSGGNHNLRSYGGPDIRMDSSLDGSMDPSDEDDSMETNFGSGERVEEISLDFGGRGMETNSPDKLPGSSSPPSPAYSLNDRPYRPTKELIGWTDRVVSRPAVFLINRYVGSLVEWSQVARHQPLSEFMADVGEILRGITEQDPQYQPSLLARVYARLERVEPGLGWTAVFGAAAAIDPRTDPRLRSLHHFQTHLISIWQDVCRGGDLMLHQRALLFLLLLMRVLGADWNGRVPSLSVAQDVIFMLLQTEDLPSSWMAAPIFAFGIGYYLEALYPFIMSGRENSSIIAFVMRDGPRSAQALDFIVQVPETFPPTIMNSLQLTLYGEQPWLAEASLPFWSFLNAHGYCGLIQAETLPFLAQHLANRLNPHCFSLIVNPDRVDFSRIIPWLPAQVFRGIRCPLTGRNAANVTLQQLFHYAQDEPAACALLDVASLSPLAFGAIQRTCLVTYLQHANPYQPLGLLWGFLPDGILNGLDHRQADLSLIAQRIMGEWEWIPVEGKRKLLEIPSLGELLRTLLSRYDNFQD